MRSRWNRRTCADCGRPRAEDERFSTRGYCDECSERRLEASITEQVEKTGVVFERWLRGTAGGVRDVAQAYVERHSP